MTIRWIEFPDINRKIAVSLTFGSLNAFLGCHAGTISGISLVFGTGVYGQVNAGKSIDLINPDKEPALKYRRDRYGYQLLENEDEVTRALKLIEENKNKILLEGYSSIIDSCSHGAIWVMSDVINGEAPARKFPNSNLGYEGHRIEILGNTGKFAKFLIDNKIGYVLESPIVQNPNHRDKKNYSLNQVWIWIHPKQIPRAINVAEQHGADLFQTRDQWVETVGKDLGIKEDPAKLFKQAFSAGVFPKENRFKRGRGTRQSPEVLVAIQKALDKDKAAEFNKEPVLNDLVVRNQA